MNRTSSSVAVAILATLSLPVSFADMSVPLIVETDDAIRVCDSLHPALIDGSYQYNTDQRLMSDAELATEQSMLQSFYARLEGEWEGHQVDRVCLGTGNRARQESRYFLHKRMEGNFRHDGLFTFRSEKHRIETPQTGKRPRTISMKPDYRLDFYPASDLQELQIVDQNTVIMTKRYHQANTYDFIATAQQTDQPGSLLNNTDGIAHLACQQSATLSADGLASEDIAVVCERDNAVRHTTARERIDAIVIEGNTVFVQTHYYTNGHYSGTESMQLKRRF